MDSFRRYITESKRVIRGAVKDYFSDSQQDKDDAIDILQSISSNEKFKDFVAEYMLDFGATSEDFEVIGLVESSAPGTVVANIPNPVDTFQGGSSGVYKHGALGEDCGCQHADDDDDDNKEELEEDIEEYDDQFLGRPVFDISSDDHSHFRTGKNRYHRWDKYLDMDDERSKRVYNYSKKHPKQSIILRNNTGVMINAKPNMFN